MCNNVHIEESLSISTIIKGREAYNDVNEYLTQIKFPISLHHLL